MIKSARMTKRGDCWKAPPESAREKAYLCLQRKILSRELPAGAALSEASIARELGSSRTPLREAIGQLIAEGFLRKTHNRGSVVVEFSQRDVAELYELREALEVYAVGKAAEHGLRPPDPDALQKLTGEILVLRRELEQSRAPRLSAAQMRRFVQVDLNYHATLVRAAGNRRILKVFADTRVLLHIFAMRRKGHEAAQLAEIHRYHSEVLAAVLRKDPEAAMRLLAEHIRVSRQERLEEYEEWERDMVMSNALSGLSIGTV
jgi:DNA-binding GntR family transcriptional regulator